MRRWLRLAAAFVLMLAPPVSAQDIPLFTGPQDVSQMQNMFNQLIQQINRNNTQPIARDNIVGANGFSWRVPSDGGAKCDGTTDDAAAIQSVIDDLVVIGGGTLYMPAHKTCAVGATLDLSANNIGVACEPSGSVSRSTTGRVGCGFLWVGAAGGTVAHFTASASPGLTGNYWFGVQIDCGDGLAATGLSITASFGFRSDGLSIINCSGGNNLYMSALASQNLNMQGALFTNTYLFNRNGYTSTALYMTCDGKRNNTTPFCTAYNEFYNTEIGVDRSVGATAKGIDLVGAGNNTFIGGRIFTLTTNPSIDFSIYDNGSGGNEMGAAGGDVFKHVLVTGQVVARGQTSFPTCNAYQSGSVAAPHCTWNNKFLDGELSNGGTQTPTIEPGAQLLFNLMDGEQTDTIAVGDGIQPPLITMSSRGLLHPCVNNALALTATNVNNPPTAYHCGAQNSSLSTYEAAQDTYALYTTGNVDGTTAVVTNIPDTSTLLANDQVSGGHIPAGTLILTVDSATQVTLTKNTTGGVPAAGEAITFGRGDRLHWQLTGSTAGQRQFELVQDFGTGSVKLPSGGTYPSAILSSPATSGTPTGTVPGFGVQTADVTFNHDTAFDHALTGVQNTMYTGFTYRCWGRLKVSTGAAGGIKVVMNGTSSGNAATSFLAMNAKAYVGTTLAANTESTTNLGASSGPTLVAVTDAVTDIVIDGTMIVNATGLWLMKVAQNVDDATNTTVSQGSYMACQQTN